MAEKILIVDDDVDSLKLIGLMLKRHGYEVVAANSGGQALVKAEAENPNLIILDVMMPDMNGLEVCRRLRAQPNTAEIPIIMFTAKTLIDDKVKGFEAGVDDYLTKPTHPAELASRVKAILARNATKQSSQKSSRGMTIGVLGAKGGVGTTTLALNLAVAMEQEGDSPTVADFRPGVGTLGLLLGFGRSQGMARLLEESPDKINRQSVENEMITYQTGLRALVSSVRPAESKVNYSLETAIAIVNALREIGKPAIFDLGYGLDETTFSLQNEMDKLVIVVEPNSACLIMARELVNELGVSGRLSLVVLNRTQSSLQTPWQEVENVVGMDVKAIIAAAPELAFQATENGTPIVLMQPGHVTSTQIVKLAGELKSRIKSLA